MPSMFCCLVELFPFHAGQEIKTWDDPGEALLAESRVRMKLLRVILALRDMKGPGAKLCTEPQLMLKSPSLNGQRSALGSSCRNHEAVIPNIFVANCRVR